MKFGQLHCGGCEKVVGNFPLDSVPTEKIEIYCDDCKENLEEQEKDRVA